MAHRLNPEQSLLIAELSDDDYANAFIFLYTIFTAGHVANIIQAISVPNSDERGTFSFNRFPERDLACSHQKIPAVGVEWNAVPQSGDKLFVYGHHGPRKALFMTRVKVLEILPNGRIIVKRIGGKLFQPGMSGSPAFTLTGEVVGVLVEEVEGSRGDRVILEPLAA